MPPQLVKGTVIYKIGHQRLKVPITLIATSIIRAEEVPMEIPDYADGALTRLELMTGESIMLSDSYAEWVESWEKALSTME